MQLKDGQRPTSDCMSHVKTKQPPCMNHQHASRQTTLCRNSHLNCLTFFTMGTQREATASRYVPSPCLGRSVDLLSMVCPSKPKPADRFAASWLRPSGHCLTQKHARANQPCFVETDCLGQKEHLCPTVFWALAQTDHGYCHPASSHGYNVHSMTRLHPLLVTFFWVVGEHRANCAGKKNCYRQYGFSTVADWLSPTWPDSK